MSIHIDKNLHSDVWLTQAEAARLRNVSPQAISTLIKRGRLTTFMVGGKKRLKRSEVEVFQSLPPGPESERRHGKHVNKYLTNTSENEEGFQKYISQAEAARFRGVSNQAIADLIVRRRLTTIRVAGRTLVLRSEIESFAARPKGRPPKKATSKRRPKKLNQRSRA
jgi:excisionase family DNA binding protein